MSTTEDSGNGKQTSDGQDAEKIGSIDRWEGLSVRDPVEGMTECMDKFTEAFQVSARRWELIVYPTLFAFIILASYGFFLIYKLTTNVDRITEQMDSVIESMATVSENMVAIADNMGTISVNMKLMETELADQTISVSNMVGTMERMNHSVAAISGTVYQIRQDMGAMTHQMHNVSRPMNFMNSIFPW
jgi:uncharacterized coiled-coil protein SlyX